MSIVNFIFVLLLFDKIANTNVTATANADNADANADALLTKQQYYVPLSHSSTTRLDLSSKPIEKGGVSILKALGNMAMRFRSNGELTWKVGTSVTSSSVETGGGEGVEGRQYKVAIVASYFGTKESVDVSVSINDNDDDDGEGNGNDSNSNNKILTGQLKMRKGHFTNLPSNFYVDTASIMGSGQATFQMIFFLRPCV